MNTQIIIDVVDDDDDENDGTQCLTMHYKHFIHDIHLAGDKLYVIPEDSQLNDHMTQPAMGLKGLLTST